MSLTLNDLATEAKCAIAQQTDPEQCEKTLGILLRVAWRLGVERAADEAQSILNDEPGKVIVEIPRLIRALAPASSRSEGTP